MTADQAKPAGPDLTLGIASKELSDGGTLLGHVGDEEVLLVRHGAEIFAVGAHCTHYHGPLAEGLIVGETVRCPWHHACFDLRTGEALRAPAISALACWSVEQQGGKIFVHGKIESPQPKPNGKVPENPPGKIVIIGGGAAGFAAAERLRRARYTGSIIMLSNDDAPPVDRPNLSKDYLAGSAPEDWVPMRGDSFYSENAIDLRLKANVTAIDPKTRTVALGDGSQLSYDRLLLATGGSRCGLPFLEATKSPCSRCAACRIAAPSSRAA